MQIQKTKLYSPVIERKEIDDSHYYFVNNEFFPSVTKILDEAMPTPFALRYWIGEVGNEKAQDKLRKAGDRGTAIHNACEALLLGGQIELIKQFPDRQDQKCIVGFVNWVAEYNPKPIEVEKVVASKLKYAGTLDLWCEIGGEQWIIDIKTSSSVYDSHKLQILAYKNALFEMTGVNAKVGILHLNPKTKKGWTFHIDLDIAGKPVTVKDFMNVYRMYRMLNGGKIPEPPKVTVYPEVLSLTTKENATN